MREGGGGWVCSASGTVDVSHSLGVSGLLRTVARLAWLDLEVQQQLAMMSRPSTEDIATHLNYTPLFTYFDKYHNSVTIHRQSIIFQCPL